MSWGAVVGATLGVAQSITANQAYIRQVGYETATKVAAIKATEEAFQADLDAFVIQNYLNESAAANAIAEAQRATGAQVRGVTQEITNKASSIVAQSGESVTGGISKARELSSFYSQASKVVGKVEEQGRGQVIKIADTLDKATQDIAAKSEQSYQKMLLSISGVSPYSSLQAPSVSDSLMAIGQGVQMGLQFEKNTSDIFATNK